MPKVLIPLDWHPCGDQLEVMLQESAPGDMPDEVLVFRMINPLPQWIKTPAATLRPQRIGDSDLFLAVAVDRLPPGKYLVGLRDHPAGEIQIVRGLRVDESISRWLSRYASLERDWANRPAAAPPTRRLKAPRFTVATTVYDTPPRFLIELASDLVRQTYADFEWRILDNGSQDQTVIDTLRDIERRDPRFVLHRVEQNIHIVPGNRYILERALGQAIVPVDSDDRMAPVALEALSSAFDAGYLIAYTDEQKISPIGRPLEPILRLPPSSLAARATCPAAHLLAFDRKTALDVGAYSESYAQGCHDWDSWLRLTDAGLKARHVPIPAYGWRVHGGSTAMSADTKDYILGSHREALLRSAARRGHEGKFTVEPIEGHEHYYHLARLPIDSPIVDLLIRVRSRRVRSRLIRLLRRTDYPIRHVTIVSDPDGRLSAWTRRAVIKACSAMGFAHPPEFEIRAATDDLGRFERAGAFATVCADAGQLPEASSYVWDAVGSLELDSDTVLVGGRVHDHAGLCWHSGIVFGLGGGVGTPMPGRRARSQPAGLGVIRRNVSGVHTGLAAVRHGHLAQLDDLDSQSPAHGIRTGLRILEAGRSCAITPGLGSVRRDAASIRFPSMSSPVASDISLSPWMSLREGEFAMVATEAGLPRAHDALGRPTDGPHRRWPTSAVVLTPAEPLSRNGWPVPVSAASTMRQWLRAPRSASVEARRIAATETITLNDPF